MTFSTNNPILAGWLIVCAAASVSGWVFSFFGVLHARSYMVVALLGLATSLAALWKWWSSDERLRDRRSKMRWRMRHIFPAAFLAYAVLSLAGGLLYPPSNYDGLTYRVPRLLHWLAGGGWHWIDSPDVRLNLSGAGFEWLSAPIVALAGTDRPLFLLNFLSFLMLPGLTYSVFKRLGVAPRVAWTFMWIIPTGYCFVLQAASIGNDLYSASLCLAALHFYLTARESRRFFELALGIVATGLLTGVKTTNLPLVLPLLVAAAPSWRLALARWPALIGVTAIALVASFAPTMVANLYQTGDWTGDPANSAQVRINHPAAGVIGNTLQIGVANALPPFVPFASAWNRSVREAAASPLFQRLRDDFPRLALTVNELAQEEAAALGLGVSSLLLVTLIGAARRRRSRGWAPAARRGLLISAATWLAFFAFMAKLGSESSPRLAAPFYPVLAGSLLLLPGTSDIIRRAWWRRWALVAALAALPALVLSPGRPLWPALTVCRQLREQFPQDAALVRAVEVYTVYRMRNDPYAPLRQFFPRDTRLVCLVGNDCPETSLWRPFGSRKVQALTATNKTHALRCDIVVASDATVREILGTSLTNWMAEKNLQSLGSSRITIKASAGPQTWHVLRSQAARASHAGTSARSASPESPQG